MEAKLEDAELIDANLQGTDLSGANLQRQTSAKLTYKGQT
jgi:uncharacterized protein YjbI with pentapeptide repeats